MLFYDYCWQTKRLFVAHGSIAVSLSELSAEVMNANGFQGQTLLENNINHIL